MIKDAKKTWFESWGEEKAQNAVLKGLLCLFIVVVIAETAVLAVLALRKPLLVAVGDKGSEILKLEHPTKEVVEKEIGRVIRTYVDSRYNWEPKTIDDNFAVASRYVGESLVKKFREEIADQIRFAKEKKVSQKFYVTDIKVLAKDGTAKVIGDRIIAVEGIRAVNPLSLEVSFELGRRSESNPEGVYITGDRASGGGK